MTARKKSQPQGFYNYDAHVGDVTEILLGLKRPNSPKAALPAYPRNLAEAMAEHYAELRLRYLEHSTTSRLTQKQTTKQLQHIRDAAIDLQKTLENLGDVTEAFAAVNPPLVQGMSKNPRLLECVASVLCLRVWSELAIDAIPIETWKGPRQNTTLAEIARTAAHDYCEITKRPPSMSANHGSFTEFLSKLLKALGIDGDAKTYARSAVADWKRAEAAQPSEPQFPHADRLKK